jgi:UV DNA damage endonuclease
VIRRLGYACIALGSPATTNRTCRLANATPERLRELIAANLDGLAEVLRYNARLDLRFFRLSSQIVPFASHPVNTLRWWDEFADQLAAIGAFARSEGMRLTMHPGQYTVLSAARPAVVAAAIADLVYHARLLDSLGVDLSGKLTIHGGGTYGDKSAAMGRFAAG